MEELEHMIEKFIRKSEASARFPHGIVRPQRDWLIALGVATLLMLLMVGYSFVLSFRVESGVVASDEGLQTRIPTINREALRENLELFDERARMLETLRLQKPSIGQP